MTRLDLSVALAERQLIRDLADDDIIEALLTETAARRRLDLSDLDPAAQAALVASRLVGVVPSVDALRDAIAEAGDRGLVVKLGIDPTSAEVHFGFVVPLMVLARLQRMGHWAVLVVGDVTARIGDPSGRSAERPPLSDDDVADNLATYRDQVAPFFDFGAADLRHNSEWLGQVSLPDLLGVLSRIPVSSALQRDDFRNRLAQGRGLAMSEFVYSVVMGLDSAEIGADLELGGVDQLLNMQMGRRVMEIRGQVPQLVGTVALVEGTDGSGAKMSKSLGNTIAVGAGADEIFAQVMSVPDRLMLPYLRAWTEWTDGEIEFVAARVDDGSLHPMDLKRILAGDVVAAVHGVPAAMAARSAFAARFSRPEFAAVDPLPTVDVEVHAALTVGAVLAEVLHFTSSLSAGRRLARQNGLRVIVERDGRQTPFTLGQDTIGQDLGAVLREVVATLKADDGREARLYLKAGRQLAALTGI